MMINKWEYLATLPLFQQVPQRELATLANSSTVTQFGRGYLFCDPNRINQTLYILVEGQVLLHRINPEGKKLNLARLGPGAIFGETALLEGDLPTHFAEAAEESLIIAIPARDLLPLVHKYPQITLQVLRTVASRLYTLEEKLEQVAFKSLRVRLAELLTKLAQAEGGSTITGYTHQELADDLGTYRETATQLLNDLRAEGFINIRRKQIHLLTAPQLLC